MGADAGVIVKRLTEEPDITIRRALLLSLGEFGDKQLGADTRNALLSKFQTIYRTDADPGLHAAAEWLLRTWKQDAWLKQVNEDWVKDTERRKKRLQGIEQLIKKDKEKTPPQWYVNGQGQTMVVIPGPVEFWMGSPQSEKDRGDLEVLHKRRIGRSFAIAAKLVTLAEHRSLTNDTSDIGGKYSYDLDLPVVFINWYMAAKYCNMLSMVEGIPEDQWCYETDAKGEVTKLKANYLSLLGYRLPSEAEMEYASRAGASTSRYYGEMEELLEQYAWYSKSSDGRLMLVGRKKPNDLGLFDVLGNCFEWCQEPVADYPKAKDNEAVEDKEGKLEVISTESRVLRGGSFLFPAANARSANRDPIVPTNRHVYYGFRPARTLVAAP